jgi:DNA-directed RNA polymerase specialized sigma subunit
MQAGPSFGFTMEEICTRTNPGLEFFEQDPFPTKQSAEQAKDLRQMLAALAAYKGPIKLCPPGKGLARDSDASMDDEPTVGGRPRFCDGERKTTEESPNNLTLYRWHDPILSAGDELDLIRAAKAGNAGAKDTLLKSFHRFILTIAKEYWGPSRGELIAAGCHGFLEAIDRYDLRRNNRLSTYAAAWIRNKMQLAVRDWRRGGQAGETRADRYVYDNRDATPEQVAAKVGCSIKTAKEAIRRAIHLNGHESYSEGTYDEDDNFVGTRPAASHDLNAEYDFYSSSQLSPQLAVYGATRRWRAVRPLPVLNRRAEALKLVERDRARVAARAEPTQYLYRPTALSGQAFKAELALRARCSCPFCRNTHKVKWIDAPVEPIAPARPVPGVTQGISLRAGQLQIVAQAAASVDPDRRDLFRQRVAAMLRLRGRFDDNDVVQITALALTGLVHQLAASRPIPVPKLKKRRHSDHRPRIRSWRSEDHHVAHL